ncbi:MAG: HNH endonuclease [Alphaproteobacteria bacterium]|nr:MAG: HNH endonuclease [Alphaproteobacteria bacterium]
MKFELNRLKEYSKESIIQEIQRVAHEVNGNSLSISVFQKRSKCSIQSVRRKFGSWQTALNEAGLSHLYSGQPVTEKMLAQKSKQLNDQEIINELKRVAELQKNIPLTTEFFKQHSNIGLEVLRNRFGSWKQALSKAEIKCSNMGKRYTDEECHENMLEVWTYYTRPPKYQEMNKPPSIVGSKAYITRFGSWNNALYEFVRRTESDVANEPNQKLISIQINTEIKQAKKPTSERREIPLGLRYKILKQDSFKCRICGNSPATDVSCKLHVDHIHPFSKEGKTVEENLRTLCAKCNIGKSDMMLE